MESTSFDQFSNTELFALEAACDEFEDDLRLGISKSISDYLDSSNPRLVSAVQREFEKIRHSVKVSGGTQMGARQISHTVTGSIAGRRQINEGQLLAGFRLLKLIGEGATSQVWKAHHLELGRDVAIKIPHGSSPGLSKRFARESQAVAKLKHPNIVAIHDVNLTDETPFLVCDLIEGESLAAAIEQQRFSFVESTELLIQITNAIAYSHQQGVIHRDVKPQNILLDQNKKPYVTDFGLARIVNAKNELLTHEGDILGTPAFMSPEQAAGQAAIDHRTDIYSVGVILFQLLTGDLPFRGNIQSIVHQILTCDPPAPRNWNKDIPEDLETICLKCLAKNPKDRFATAGDLLGELTRFKNHEPIHSRPISPWGRFRKWMVRNPAVAAVTSFAILLLVGLAAGGIAFGLAMAAAHETEYRLRMAAESAEQEALSSQVEKEQALRRERQKVQEAKRAFRFIGATFEKAEPILAALSGTSAASNQPLTTEQLFRTAAQRLKKQFPGDPESQAELIDILGNSCRSHGLFKLAQDLLKTGQEIRDRHRSRYAEADYQFQTTRNRFFRGQVQQTMGELDLAERCFLECLNLPVDSGTRELLIAAVHFQLGQLYLAVGRNLEARNHFAEAVQIREKHLTAESNLLKAAQIGYYFCDYLDGNHEVLTQINQIGAGQGWVGKAVFLYSQILNPFSTHQDKVATYRQLLTLLENYLPSLHPILLTAKGDFANLLWKVGLYSEAQQVIVAVIEQGEKICPDHYQLRNAKLHYAKELHRSGEHRQAIPILESLLQDQRNKKLFNEIRHSLLWCYYLTDNLDAARKEVEELLPQVQHKSREEAAWIQYSAARIYQKCGDAKFAELDAKAYRFSQFKNPLPQSGFWSRRLAIILLFNHDLPRALKMIRNAIQLEAKRFHPLHPRVANGRMIHGRILAQMKRTEDAICEFELALKIRQASLPADSPLIRECEARLKQLKQNPLPDRSSSGQSTD